jgi:hypothetical protein
MFLYQNISRKVFGASATIPKMRIRKTLPRSYIVFRSRVTRHVAKNFHLGLQYRLEYAFNFKVDSTGQLAEGNIPGSDGYLSSGAGVAAIYDTRDNSNVSLQGMVCPVLESFLSALAWER